MKYTCEKCSMEATYIFTDSDGLIHHYCDHHAPSEGVRIEGVVGTQPSFRKFLPLVIIFSVIVIFTIVATYFHGYSLDFSMRMMMGSFFAIFGLFKVFNLRAFADAYSTYDILAKRSRTYSFIYPFLEIGLAVLYLSDIGGIYRDIFTFILMSVSAIGVIQKLRLKEDIPCACLGMVFKLPMTKVTLFEDVLMAGEALIMVFIAL